MWRTPFQIRFRTISESMPDLARLPSVVPPSGTQAMARSKTGVS